MRIVDGDATTAEVAAWEATRRDAVRRGLVAGTAGILGAAAIPLLLGVSEAFAESHTDGEILESAVGLEQVAVFAYRAAGRSPACGARLKRTFGRLGNHEGAHVQALLTQLEALGAAAPPPPRTLKDVDRVLPGLGEAGSQTELATFAVELETAAVAAYHDALQKLQDPKILQTAASIMGSEGQHLVVLRTFLGQQPIPDAFEAGKAEG